MLNKLEIKNVALIENASINFSDGINVLSGETGAGKSVILESLNFVLGAKADKSLIRYGEDNCFVKAEFDVSNSELDDLFDEYDLEKDDILIVSRKFTMDGKSVIKINGETVTVGMLRTFSSRLVDVHGQSEHFYLLKESNQLDLLDKIGGEEVLTLKSTLKSLYNNYKKVVSELEGLGGDESQRLVRIDILKYQISEIENANIKEGEEENLISIKEKLKHQEKITSALDTVLSAISSEGGINDRLAVSVRALSSIAEIDNKYSELYDRLDSVYAEIRDIDEYSKDYVEDLSGESLDIDAIESRLETIKNIKRKYGEDFNAVQNTLSSLVDELERLENFNEVAKTLLDNKYALELKLYDNYVKLDDVRRVNGEKFTKNVINELTELGMKGSKFEISFTEKPSIENCEFNSSNGFSRIKFLFSANSGEKLKPLSDVISGGEMSRFMLAIKAQTAKYNNISTFIFDEIDAGISGIIAKVVARKIVNISNNVQIIAISHLPQIASFANKNLLIYKEECDGRTLTHIKELSEEEKVFEIVRLVGGDQNSTSALLHAKELIDQANEYKRTNN